MRSLLCVVAGAALAACGGSNGHTPDGAPIPPADGHVPVAIDAAPDADLRDAPPPPRNDAGMLAFGQGVVLQTVHLADTGHSWAPYAPLVNVQFDQAVQNGTMLLLVEFRGLSDPSGQNDPDGLDLGIYNGVDLDGNPNDNFSGMEPLQVAAESLDAAGNPRALLPGASLAGGQVSGMNPGPLLMHFPTLGDVHVYNAVFSGTLTAGGGGTNVASLMTGTISGVLLARDLGATPNPVPTMCTGSTLLDVIALGCLSIPGIQPDVDRDGDGLEHFADEGVPYTGVVDTCYDGSGTKFSSVPGTPCVADAAFQDGYTVRLNVDGVRAILLPP